MNRLQQEWAVMAIVGAILSIGADSRFMGVVASACVFAMLIIGWVDRR